MANKTASFAITLTYKDESDGNQRRLNTIEADFTSFVTGALDVPDETVEATVFTVPFGSVELATAVWVKNSSTQALLLKLNGEGDKNLGVGEEFVIVDPSGSSTPTAITLTTTVAVEGDGTIEYRVFGDPV